MACQFKEADCHGSPEASVAPLKANGCFRNAAQDGLGALGRGCAERTWPCKVVDRELAAPPVGEVPPLVQEAPTQGPPEAVSLRRSAPAVTTPLMAPGRSRASSSAPSSAEMEDAGAGDKLLIAVGGDDPGTARPAPTGTLHDAGAEDGPSSTSASSAAAVSQLPPRC